MNTQPVWPVIIKQDEVHDVSLIENQEDWLSDSSLSRFPYNEHDVLIDSRGSVFRLVYNKDDKTVSFTEKHPAISLEEFSLLLRKHLCTLNECCISKLSVSSYAEGFEIIRHSLDNT